MQEVYVIMTELFIGFCGRWFYEFNYLSFLRKLELAATGVTYWLFSVSILIHHLSKFASFFVAFMINITLPELQAFKKGFGIVLSHYHGAICCKRIDYYYSATSRATTPPPHFSSIFIFPADVLEGWIFPQLPPLPVLRRIKKYIFSSWVQTKFDFPSWEGKKDIIPFMGVRTFLRKLSIKDVC